MTLSFLKRVFVSLSTYPWCGGTVGLQGLPGARERESAMEPFGPPRKRPRPDGVPVNGVNGSNNGGGGGGPGADDCELSTVLGTLDESFLVICVVFLDMFMCFHSACVGYFSTCPSYFLGSTSRSFAMGNKPC